MMLVNILAFAAAASAHTLFTTLYIDGKNQGDGTCVRMPKNGATGTAPIYPIDGDAMACGYGGRDPVSFVCPASSGSKLTFEFRLWPDASQPGALDPGHKGPCAVYLKRLDDMSSPAAGPGWFKIWEDGYDNSTAEWCTDRLIGHDGLLSVDLPTGLPPGYYLARPEILALHWAYKGDPQFYTGCAQIFVQGGPAAPSTLQVPAQHSVSIPGYVSKDMPGLAFDIYKEPMPAYPIPGPAVFVPTSRAPASLKKLLAKGAVPPSCLLKNANWCANPVGTYSDMKGCWAGVKDCYDQSKMCWDSAPASGSANCYTWSDYCSNMNDACERKEYEGPPRFEGKEKFAPAPGAIPEVWNNVFAGTNVGAKGDGSAGAPESKTTTASGVSTTLSKASSKTMMQSATTLVTVSTTASTRSAVVESPAAGPTGTREPDDGKSSGLVDVSTGGQCGPEVGQTCSGSVFGDCCSPNGDCGSKEAHCGCGCVPEYGSCW